MCDYQSHQTVLIASAAQMRRLCEVPEIAGLLDQIVTQLRRVGRHEFIPLGLLARARFRFLRGDIEEAQDDLNDAWEYAERDNIKLHAADICLHRACFFRNKDELKRARALIEQCGYWRRKRELEKTEEAAKNWK